MRKSATADLACSRRALRALLTMRAGKGCGDLLQAFVEAMKASGFAAGAVKRGGQAGEGVSEG